MERVDDGRRVDHVVRIGDLPILSPLYKRDPEHPRRAQEKTELHQSRLLLPLALYAGRQPQDLLAQLEPLRARATLQVLTRLISHKDPYHQSSALRGRSRCPPIPNVSKTYILYGR